MRLALSASVIVLTSFFRSVSFYRVTVRNTPNYRTPDLRFPLCLRQRLRPLRLLPEVSLPAFLIPPDHRPCRPFIHKRDAITAEPLFVVSPAKLSLRMFLQAGEANKYLRTGR